MVDALNGVPEAFSELLRFPDSAISIVTWIELMAGARPSEFQQIQDFIHRFPLKVIQLSWPIATWAAIRRGQLLRGKPKRNLKLPDAIILATALVGERLLITRNVADFNHIKIRIPYRLSNGAVSDVAPLP